MTKQNDPTWATHNGLGVVNFDGDDSLYSTNWWGGGGEFSMFSIARYTHSDNTYLVISDRQGYDFNFGFSDGRMERWRFRDWVTNINNGKDTNFHLHSATINSSDQANTYYHGTQVGTVNSNGAHDTDYTPRQIQFGGKQTSTAYSKCEVAEFIAFNRVLTATERQEIEGYLAHKWGLSTTLPDGHIGKANPPGIGSGLVPEFTVTSPTQAYPIPVSVTFKKGGSSTAVSGFTLSDLNVSGATASGFSGSGHTYTFNLTPSANPSQITLTVNDGGAQVASTGERSQRSYKSILYRPTITREDKLALWLPLWEQENATTVEDWGPHRLTSKVTSNPTRVPGRSGSAFRFDGDDDKITIFNHRFMRMPGTGQYTVNAWVRHELDNSGNNFVLGRSGRNYWLMFGNSNNAAGSTVFHRTRTTASNDFGPGTAYRVPHDSTWNMVTITNQGLSGLAKTYIDGAPSQIISMTHALLFEPDHNIYIGAGENGNGDYFKGAIQDLRMYDYALTDSEVATLYSSIESELGAPVITNSGPLPFNAATTVSIPATATVPLSAFPPTWSATGLPSGLDINATTGVISGTASGSVANTGTDHTVVLSAASGFV